MYEEWEIKLKRRIEKLAKDGGKMLKRLCKNRTHKKEICGERKEKVEA